MKPRRTLAFSALVLLAPCLLHAQPSPATVTGVVTGLVTDQSTHDPLESASVVLRSRADSSQVAGATTGKDGAFRFETVKPGRTPAPDGGEQAPHIVVSVMARGILTRFLTRIYFEDEASNAHDPVLALVPEERRGTLMARRTGQGRYRFDLVMQGAGETVFFDV